MSSWHGFRDTRDLRRGVDRVIWHLCDSQVPVCNFGNRNPLHIPAPELGVRDEMPTDSCPNCRGIWRFRQQVKSDD